MIKVEDRNTLRERFNELKETAEHPPHTLESTTSNVLVMAGYSEFMYMDRALVYLIPRMSLKGLTSILTSISIYWMSPRRIPKTGGVPFLNLSSVGTT
jgi:hypothetical protein